MPLKILIAPSCLKESISAVEAADAIERGVLKAVPDAVIQKLPLSDGGEGFARTMTLMKGGELRNAAVRGPLGEARIAQFGFLETEQGNIALIDAASASGLRLVPPDCRNPLLTTSFGVGELIRAALDANASRIIVGCGDTATNDGGAGIAQALGVKFLDKNGIELGYGGAELASLEAIDLSGRDLRLARTRLEILCSLTPFPGSLAAASVLTAATLRFAPQKGATPSEVAVLVRALERLSSVVRQQLGIDLDTMPGAGACGGMGGGMHALLGAKLRNRSDFLTEFVRFEDYLCNTDLVITAEGKIDSQTVRDKLPALVAKEAKRFGLPVVALAGIIGDGAELNLAHGIDAFASVIESPCTLAEAIEGSSILLEHGAETAMRLIAVGAALASCAAHPISEES